MAMKLIISAVLILTCQFSLAHQETNPYTGTQGIITSAHITKVTALEKSDGSIEMDIEINTNEKVGPNPHYTYEDCVLSTYTESVMLLSLHAVKTGHHISLRYVGDGDDETSCKVRYLALEDD